MLVCMYIFVLKIIFMQSYFSRIPFTVNLNYWYFILITENTEYLGIQILYLRNFNINNNTLLYSSKLCELNGFI